MVDKLVRNLHRIREETWKGVKKGVWVTGYEYYKEPEGIKYRFPAPGSCALAEEDHHNLYKEDWKMPFRHSEFNVRPIEQWPRDDETGGGIDLISRYPSFPEGHRLHGKDPDMVDLATLQEDDSPAIGSDEMKDELWKYFEGQPEEMEQLADNFGSAVAKKDYDQDYNQQQMLYHNRGLTGFENNPRAKETFIELEHWIEEVIGKKRITEGKTHLYKGQPKKWQILDDACFDRDQVEKLQAACDAPLPEQLEQWKEKHEKPLMHPFTNANIQAWRDDPKAIESADFDPVLLGQDRQFKRRMFLERFEKPKQLEAETKE